MKQQHYLVTQYNRAQTIPRLRGASILPTRDDSLLTSLVTRAKLDRLSNSRMCYKMRLSAMVASDSRQGRAGV